MATIPIRFRAAQRGLSERANLPVLFDVLTTRSDHIPLRVGIGELLLQCLIVDGDLLHLFTVLIEIGSGHQGLDLLFPAFDPLYGLFNPVETLLQRLQFFGEPLADESFLPPLLLAGEAVLPAFDRTISG